MLPALQADIQVLAELEFGRGRFPVPAAVHANNAKQSLHSFLIHPFILHAHPAQWFFPSVVLVQPL